MVKTETVPGDRVLGQSADIQWAGLAGKAQRRARVPLAEDIDEEAFFDRVFVRGQTFCSGYRLR